MQPLTKFALNSVNQVARNSRRVHRSIPSNKAFAISNPSELFDSLEKNENMSKSEFVKALRELRMVELEENNKEEKQSISSMLSSRFAVTAEVAVSKLLPAGMGWQGFSILAENAGFAANDFGFFAMTGMGDAVGVGLGHTLYYSLKKSLYDKTIDMKEQSQTALLLATATFFSGTAWQPAVNFFQSAETSFTVAAVGTGVVTGSMFFTGLRFGRNVYSALGCEHIEESNDVNKKSDAALSVAIGGATAAFVGTDVSYGDANFLRPIVGIEEGMSSAAGIATAGLSTALGFSAVQTVQNLTVSRGKNWVD
jgi:hypothetical protein